MQNLSSNDSVDKVADASKRHIRLCKRSRNGNKYENAITIVYDTLASENKTLSDVTDEYKFAQDGLYLAEHLLDDQLRKANGRCKEFDRDNPGAKTAELLFENGVITPILKLDENKKASAVTTLLQKLASLGESHTLYNLYADIKTANNNLLASIKEVSDANSNVQKQDAIVLLAKNAVIKQYTSNYHSAVVDYDQGYAELLFPVLKPATKKATTTTTTDTTTAAS